MSTALEWDPAREVRLFEDLSRLNNELATAQRELAKKNAELARLNEQKNQFLGIAAHDLRNPLEVILTYSDFLLDFLHGEGDCLPPEHLEFVRTIHTSSAFMLNLVNDLLDLSKIEAGRLELDLSQVDLAKLVARNVTLNRALAAKKGTEIVFRQEGELPPLRLDAAKIEQVLNNLIGNAVKFSPPESTVEVRLAAAPEDGWIVLSVADQGEGLPLHEVDQMEKLFRPFERTRVRSTGDEKSTGLGLAIVKSIVTGHRGEIRVESEPGQGATFHVRLPMGRDTA
jgi:signal transduction histidine kinase